MKETKSKISPYGSIKFSSIEQYHTSFPEAIKEKLQQLHQAIKQCAPNAVELISYNIPTFKQHKKL
nr:DUF1801 domain-containing protein [Chitinophagaceae bacterium]